MTDYVIGKKPIEVWKHWRKVNLVSNFNRQPTLILCYYNIVVQIMVIPCHVQILFPANVNGNHWVTIAIDLKEQVIKIYDSLPEINSVLEITKWTSCLRKMLPSLLVHTMPDIYTDALPFAVQRPEKDVPNQGNGYTTNQLLSSFTTLNSLIVTYIEYICLFWINQVGLWDICSQILRVLVGRETVRL